MRRFTVFASVTAAASLALVACVSDDNNGPVTQDQDAGQDSTVAPPIVDGGGDAPISDGATDAGSLDAGDSATAPEPFVCSDAGTGLCLIVLAENQSNPVVAALHGGFLYWVQEGLVGTAQGNIQRVPVTGGTPQVVVSGLGAGAFDMTIDNTSVYWADEYSGTVYSAPNAGITDGGAPTLLATVDGGSPYSVTVDTQRIYWTDFNNGKIYAAPLGGTGGAPPTLLASGQSEPWDITNDGTNLYFTINTATGAVMAMSLTDGGAPYPIVPSVDRPTELQVSNGTVYFISSTANVVYSAPTTGITDGGSPSILATTGSDTSLDASTVTTTSFAYDGTTVFWTTSGNPGGEVRSATPGGPATTLAFGMTSPGSVVFDTSNIYWTNFAYGAVFEMAKP